jgi:DHA3 family macrolide efflux protein-like MFS transporter
MLMLKALKHSSLRRLWLSQATSSVGDEIYRVGLTWLAVGLIGPDTGYLNAAQAAALMILSFVGGKWADHWDPFKTMVRVDLLRAFIVLSPVVYSFFAPVPFALLCAMALSLSALGAFFDPALQMIMPRFAPDPATLRGANGLMGTTIRMARMIGPLIVGIFALVIPPIHFFSLDSLTFFASALFVTSLRSHPAAAPAVVTHKHQVSFKDAIFSGFRTIRRKRGMEFIFAAKAVTTGTWALTISLGLALMVQKMAPHEIKAFGLAMGSYGAGNFAGALFFGNRERPHPVRMMFWGYIFLGAGFVWMGLAPGLLWLMVAGAAAGFTGPMNDLTFIDILQDRFTNLEIPKVFRLRMAIETASILFVMLLSPFLFRVMEPGTVVSWCGVIWIVVGALGLAFRLHKL